ncbi:hypothetical protein [Halorientalis sp.]|jgi:hypothetical protein|nr:hypothetical protein [Halorientalis sp.]
MFGAELVAGLALAVLPCMIALFYAFIRFEPTDEHLAEADDVSQ